MTFGYYEDAEGVQREINIIPAIQQLIQNAGRLCSTDAQLILRDRYETVFGILNHESEAGQHPFALIRMNKSEDPIPADNSLHDWMRRYIDNDVMKYFGISFDEFLDRPTYQCYMLIEECRKRIEKEAPLIEDALSRLRGGNQGAKA